MRHSIVPSLAALALALAGCTVDSRGADAGPRADTGPVLSDAGPPRDTGPRPDVGPPRDAGVCSDVVDVVFVLDVSSTMRFVLQALEDDIPGLVAAAGNLAPDAHFGFVGFSDNHAFADQGSMGIVHTNATSLRAAFAEFRTTYTEEDRNPGDGPGGPTVQNPICEENSLDAIYAAASEFPWRESATRVIIVATDDTFLEAPDNYGDRDGDGDTTSTDFPREGDYPAAHTVSETIALLQQSRIRVFSFTRQEAPGFFDPGACGTGRRLNDDDVTDGWSTNYGLNEPFPVATDGADFDLIDVRDGSLDLATTINQVVVESYCDPPLI